MTIIADYQNGIGIRKLSDKYGIGWRRIRRLLLIGNVLIKKKSEKKFDTDEAIRNYKAGATIPLLSRLYNVSTSAIWERLKRVISCRSYSHYQKYRYFLPPLKNLSSEIGAYWFGFFLADGYICTSAHRRSVQHRLICKLSWRDYDHLKKLCKTIRIKKLPQLRYQYNKVRDRTYRYAILGINSKELCDFYIRNGWNDFKRGKFSFPKQLNLRHFLRGLWDGDGTVSWGKKYLIMGYADMNRNTIELLQSEIIKLVRQQTGTIIKPNKILHYETKNKTQMYRTAWVGRQAILIAKSLYSGCALALERKLSKLRTCG